LRLNRSLSDPLLQEIDALATPQIGAKRLLAPTRAEIWGQNRVYDEYLKEFREAIDTIYHTN
jgi:hypothetical protein